MKGWRRVGGGVLAAVVAGAPAVAHQLPQDLMVSSRLEYLFDRGWHWEGNSMFHPLETWGLGDTDRTWQEGYVGEFAARLRALEAAPSGLVLVGGFGAEVEAGPGRRYSTGAAQPFVHSQAQLHRYWSARLTVRATNQPASLEHYTALPRSISRGGLNSAEFDQAAVGFRNGWAQVEFGRGREIWGPLTEDNLLLSGSSPSYDRLAFQVNYGRFAGRWFYGFLEAVADRVSGMTMNRYITGRAIEYRNRRNLVVGVGEVSVLSGVNRPVDLAFLNPLAVHLEVEQNRRSNETGNSADAVWFAHVDWLPAEDWRLSATGLLDEIQLDRADRRRGDADALGGMIRVAWTPRLGNGAATLHARAVRLDTYLFQHRVPFNNFVARNRMLGSPLGNDADLMAAGVSVNGVGDSRLSLEYGRERRGENSLLRGFYTSSENRRAPFPSGRVSETRYVGVDLDARVHRRLGAGFRGKAAVGSRGPEAGSDVWEIWVGWHLPLMWVAER